jgi:hypothetical protein
MSEFADCCNNNSEIFCKAILRLKNFAAVSFLKCFCFDIYIYIDIYIFVMVVTQFHNSITPSKNYSVSM